MYETLLPARPDARLTALVRATAADPRRWREHVRFDAGTRYWHRLAQLPDADLWLLTWMPQQGTDLHDHGGSVAAFTVVQGALDEVRIGPNGLTRRTLSAGQQTVVPADEVHDVSNHGTEPAISIHAYSPQLTSMNFWGYRDGVLHPLSTYVTDQPEVA